MALILVRPCFHLIGINRRGGSRAQKSVSTSTARFTANVRVERIGKEACEERISWAGIARVGHEVRLIRAQYVKLYVKTNKSDYMDAETIAEAAGRPTVTIFTQALESV